MQWDINKKENIFRMSKLYQEVIVDDITDELSIYFAEME